MLRVLKGTPYEKFRPGAQTEAAALSVDSPFGNIFEIPTGHGKSPLGMAIALNGAADGREAYYVTPTKAQVEQIGTMFPNHTSIAFGRGEYRCLYYVGKTDEYVSAQDSPCRMICRTKRCVHEVDMATGRTIGENAEPCPYYLAKYRALVAPQRNKIPVVTTAFFLMNRMMMRFNVEEGEDEERNGICAVIDEAHNLPKIARGIYEFTLTDHTLEKAEAALKKFLPDQAKIVQRFRINFMRMARRKRPSTGKHREYKLLEDEEIGELMDLLEEFNRGAVERAVSSAMSDGALDPTRNREEIKLLENLVRNIPAFVRSLKYSLEDTTNPDKPRKPLNYVVAFHYKKYEEDGTLTRKKARHYLTIKAYYVVPLISRIIGEGAKVTAMSATIGNPSIFGYETGFKMPFTSFPSNFDAQKTMVIMPTDTPNLSSKFARRDDPKKARRMVLDGIERFFEHGKRSLILVNSEDERQTYMRDAVKRGIYAVTYTDEMPAREVAMRFREGDGDVLIGTDAQYGEGLDLPGGICPVIWFIRPGYQRPDDPMTQFEEKRFPQSHCWSLWQYRVMIKALQARGRNIRTAEDLGVSIFVSQQFHKFLYGALPEWLKPSYRGKLALDEAIDEALKLLI